MLDKKTVLRLIGSLLIFIVFIALPFILFIKAMLFLSDDSAFGMFIRLFNMAALPIEILSVGIINLIGFFILKKKKQIEAGLFDLSFASDNYLCYYDCIFLSEG